MIPDPSESSPPLAGIQILDLTTVMMGPFGTHILADLGAEIIKVEPPEGDPFRRYGPMRSPGMGGSVLNLHRNKRSIALDLKSPQGRSVLDEMLLNADVLVHNMRPAAAGRLRLDWASISAINPRMVLCAARGFSEEGPYGQRAAYDDLIQAGSGMASLFAHAGGAPRYVPTAVCDKIAGQAVAYAVLAALLHRERGGHGQAIEVPMFEVAIEFVMAEHLNAAAFRPPLGPMGFHRQLSRNRAPYRTRDGWACILPYSDKNWSDFFAFIERNDLSGDARFADVDRRGANSDALYAIVAQYAPLHATADWVAFCERASIPCMPVLTLQDLFEDEHVKATGLIRAEEHPTEGAYWSIRSPIRFGRTSYALRRHAPRLGQDTGEILDKLKELGSHDE